LFDLAYVKTPKKDYWMLENLYKAHFNHLRKIYDDTINKLGYDKLIVHSGDTKLRFQDDLPASFFVNISFKALVPLLDAPNSWIVWRVGKTPRLLIYQPRDYWHAVPKIEERYWSNYFEITAVTEPGQAKALLGNTKNTAFLGESLSYFNHWDVGQRNPTALLSMLHWHRSFKTDYEVECIAVANQISFTGHQAARNAFFAGGSELEISLAFQQGCSQSEEQLAYPSIVGIDQHAAILHYWGRSHKRVKNRQRHSLLIDAGAGCNGYAADITRTYAYQSGLFAEMILELDQVQLGLVQEHRIGCRYIDVHQMMLHQVLELLCNFDLVLERADNLPDTRIADYFLPHGIGHFLGLQVHDVGSNQADSSGALVQPDKRNPKFKMLRPIERSHVVTVEPGLYFIDLLLKDLSTSQYRKLINWPLIEELKPSGGIRIEDNIVITESGPRNLTREAFSSLDA
jgi:Xaa-Pro dipeptidase